MACVDGPFGRWAPSRIKSRRSTPHPDGVFFAAHPVATVDLTNRSPVSHGSEQVSVVWLV